MSIGSRTDRLIFGIAIVCFALALAVRYVRSTPRSPDAPAPVSQARSTSDAASDSGLPPVISPSDRAPAPGAPAAPSLADAWAALQGAVAAGDDAQLESVAETLESLAARMSAEADAGGLAEAERMRRQALRARDALMGSAYLDGGEMPGWALMDEAGRALVGPADMCVGGGDLYVLDSGVLYRTPMPAAGAAAGGTTPLVMTPLLRPADLVDGFPIKELVAVEAQPDGATVYALDKSNDVYRYDGAAAAWHVLPMAPDRHDDPSPMYLSMATFDDRLYVLDPARNQVWRSPPSAGGDGVLPGVLPWLVQPGAFDVSDGVDVAVDGNVYTLLRKGRVVAYPANAAGYDVVAVADRATSVSGLNALGSLPSAVALAASGTGLFVADPGRRRIVWLDRTAGSFVGQWIAPEVAAFDHLSALAVDGDRLLLLAGSTLVAVAIEPAAAPDAAHLPELPTFVARSDAGDAAVATSDLPPNDPRLPARLDTIPFVMPIAGAELPDRNAVYPGSRRTYRYGVHEGLDLFAKDIGVPVVDGTPVVAAADGVILRIDQGYQEMSLGEVNGLLDAAHALHITPVDTLEKLNGRQVWIDHDGVVASRYSHLSAVADGLEVGQRVRAGQVIGNVGLSGTPDGIVGNTQFPHLHFELRFGAAAPYAHYLGKWLSTEQTRRVFERVFGVRVRPAYMDERGGG